MVRKSKLKLTFGQLIKKLKSKVPTFNVNYKLILSVITALVFLTPMLVFWAGKLGIISTGTVSDILSYAGSIIGVLGAYAIAMFQLNKKQDDLNLTRKVNLIIGDQNVRNINFSKPEIHKAIYEGEQTDLSTLQLKLINGSSMPNFNFSIEWKIGFEGINDNERMGYLVNNTDADSTYNFHEFIDPAGPKQHSDNDKIYSEDFYRYRSEKNEPYREPAWSYNYFEGELKRNIPILESYNSIDIPLPKFFLVLIENVINYESYKTFERKMHGLPTLYLKIHFMDYEKKQITHEYKIQVSQTKEMFGEQEGLKHHFTLVVQEL